MEAKYEIIMFGRGFVVITDINQVTAVEEFGTTWLVVPRYTTIRNWGASHGIGEIVHQGPNSNTVCDPQLWEAKISVATIYKRILIGNEAAFTKWKKKIQETDNILLTK